MSSYLFNPNLKDIKWSEISTLLFSNINLFANVNSYSLTLYASKRKKIHLPFSNVNLLITLDKISSFFLYFSA